MLIRPFRGLRPHPDKVRQGASRPYDVLSSEEARAEAAGNPLSFLNVVKPEISLPPETDPYAPEVYETGRQYFRKLLADGIFFQDPGACLYIYELVMNGRSQTGIVACAAVQDYLDGRIKKHELTRPDKEADRKRHVRISMLNAEPVFFAYRAVTALGEIVAAITKDIPEYDFTTDDGIRHRLWVVREAGLIRKIVGEFERIPATYVADGHHRTAAAARVGDDLRKENPGHTGDSEYNYFLAVHFPDNQLSILDYNRIITDLNGMGPDAFLSRIAGAFYIEKHGEQTYKPEALHRMGMYLDGNWYALTAKPGTWDDRDPIGVLDVTILSREILEPVLNIHDLRTDRRIDFIGGIRGMQELSRRVDSGEMAVAFAMYPVSMKQLMDIADSGNIMPPKVTWFEPKLRSGLVVHSLQD